MMQLIPIAKLLEGSPKGKDFASQDAKSFLFWWNNSFPLDYWYRKKFNLRFNSPEHRATSFVDMWLEKQEEHEMKQSFFNFRKWQERVKDYEKTGRILAESPDEEPAQNQLFDDIDFGSLNNLNINEDG
jgi:hypothetical protein